MQVSSYDLQLCVKKEKCVFRVKDHMYGDFQNGGTFNTFKKIGGAMAHPAPLDYIGVDQNIKVQN